MLNLVQSHPGLQGDFGHPNIYGFPLFQVILLPRLKNVLPVTDFRQDNKCSTQTAQFIFKHADVRFDCSFSTKSRKFDHLKIDRF